MNHHLRIFKHCEISAMICLMPKDPFNHSEIFRRLEVSSWYPQSKGLLRSGATFGNKGIPLQEPSSVCVDGGWLYVADSKTHMVSRWSLEDATLGEIVAGGRGPGDTLEQLNRPTGVAVDSVGRVYVSVTWRRSLWNFLRIPISVGLQYSVKIWDYCCWPWINHHYLLTNPKSQIPSHYHHWSTIMNRHDCCQPLIHYD